MSQTFKDLKKDQFKALMSCDIKGPIQMLNLLKYKDYVEETKLSGEDQYAEYMKAAFPFLQNSKSRVIYQGKPNFAFIGPKETEWDKIIIVEYDSIADFISMISQDGYPAQVRRMAIEDSRLILCQAK